MTSPWIGLIGALAGIVVGAGLEALRSRWAFQREKGWAVWDDQRLHLEAVYEALEVLRESYAQSIGDLTFSMITASRPQRDTPTLKVPWARLRMLVHLYCPWLIEHLKKVEKVGPRLGSAIGDAIVRQSGDRIRDESLINNATNALEELNTAVDAMCDAIVEASRNLDEKRWSLLGSRKGLTRGSA